MTPEEIKLLKEEMESSQKTANICYELCLKYGKDYPIYNQMNEIYKANQENAFKISVYLESTDASN
jgi:hypothetical protein